MEAIGKKIIMHSLSIYVHWPFCVSKCPYCDFNSHVAKSNVNLDEWIKAYINELEYFYSQIGNRNVATIYFGGGTPSLMNPLIVDKIINKIDELWGINEGREITIEANPHSIEYNKFIDFKNAGVNRVSIGVQALNDNDLEFLGRTHNVNDIYKAIEVAQKTFDNYTFDLIYARPEQSINEWIKELQRASILIKNHISLYQLTIEKGTPFYKKYKDNSFELPSEEKSARMYEITEEYLADSGINLYEISNYAKSGYESKHNLAYWNYKDFIGIGAGAHGRYINIKNHRIATVMHHDPKKWLNNSSGDIMVNDNIMIDTQIALQSKKEISIDESISEMLLMGLRLAKGISKNYFSMLFDSKIENHLNMKKVQFLSENGFVDNNNTTISITSKGRLLYNKIISDLLG